MPSSHIKNFLLHINPNPNYKYKYTVTGVNTGDLPKYLTNIKYTNYRTNNKNTQTIIRRIIDRI